MRAQKNKTEEVLNSLYYDTKKPSAFSGPYTLYKAAKKVLKTITLSKVKDYLSGQDSHTLHVQAKKPRTYRKTIAHYPNHIHQADLIDVSALSKENKGNKFILTNIDVFSRKAWAIPIKNKRGASVIEAFKKIHKDGKVLKVQTDQGAEFLNREVQHYFKSKKIEHYFSASDFKAAVCERFNRTLKSKLYKYFTKSENFRYLNVLKSIVDGYNNTVHSSIGISPVKVNKRNRKKVWNYQYKNELKKSKSKFKYKIGDRVRLVKIKKTFGKGYLPSFTQESFQICDRLNTTPLSYKVMDKSSEILKGTFYAEELTKVKS